MSTFAQLKDNCSLELGLDETASGDEDTLLGRRLNEGVRKVLLKTKCRIAVATTNLTANENDYELPSDVLATNNIVNADNQTLDRVSVEEIHLLRRGDTPVTGPYPYRYAVDGANLLLLYPTPSAAETLTLYYVPKPTEMSSGANDPSTSTYGGIPVENHDLIELWACYKMARYDDAVKRQEYLDDFRQGTKEMRAETYRRGGRKLGPARVGRRRFVHPDPSADYR
jgi:hypothetical protein